MSLWHLWKARFSPSSKDRSTSAPPSPRKSGPSPTQDQIPFLSSRRNQSTRDFLDPPADAQQHQHQQEEEQEQLLPTQEPEFIYEDIDPPAEYEYPPSPDEPTPLLQDHTDMLPSSPSSTSSNNMMASTLPGYNDVSGAVIVDWNGLPHFLSPQEEEDRKVQLERAVRERMLGHPIRTDFTWERPYQGPGLPQYSPTQERRRRAKWSS
ncbi:hypothetical protein BDW42DRAFT_186653 [Aspergillus taichungensis]|uniref:Uncharacterized protein n=1 Tax=Aspergillus taichungensis TaxID=482145 RepID=A0A2J5HQS4_9EURO|nr:hypothetical protein BDW42DRAFT_186653 [Aspergillus taichungensis]